ncbi:MAG: 50S ribosomal protein L6 [Dehalococcoidia bacterium]
MSRIGKKPVQVPGGVEVSFKGNDCVVTGPKGTLSRSLPPDIKVEIEGDVINVYRPTENRHHRALHGLTRTLVANMVYGVSEGYHKVLEIVGVGYRAQSSGDKLTLLVGYSRPVEVTAPEGISFSIEGTNKITVAGIDKELVGETAANIRAIRPPDHYKGKGIRYSGERVRLKAGKAGKVGAKKK